MTADVWTFLAGGASALLVAVATQALTMWREVRGRKSEWERDGRYLAIRLVCILDRFVNECCSVVQDDGIFGEHGEREGAAASPDYKPPADVEWRSFTPELMYRSLSFVDDIEAARHEIREVQFEVSTPPDHDEFFEERASQYAKLGLKALKLAEDLRSAYSIPKREHQAVQAILARGTKKIVGPIPVISK
ncbi:hypothetical protein [Hyphomicrobium sp. CS1BSMeth3]|uniref:hypothetical protein n=1 Tax=Hyphomicrobium sp. CS1BSMeth3 TaxID=1892844 RepID=UPI0011601A48|nr:hypothetical protein [Hyphomicrobium sp. CS1BSMeth3]